MTGSEHEQKQVEEPEEAVAEQDDAEGDREDEPESSLPAPMEAVLEEIPPEQRDRVRSSFQGLFMGMGPMPNPLLSKLSEANLDKIIQGAENDNKRSYEDRDKSRRHVRKLFIMAVVAFLVVASLFLWMDQTALLENLVQVAIVFGGGIGVGVGFLKPRRSE